MNYETTLRALLDDAASTLRASLKDAVIATLVDDQRGAVFDLLRKAYDLGYREALANARRSLTSATPSAPPVQPTVATALPPDSPPATATFTPAPAQNGEEDEDDDWEPEPPGYDLFSSAPDPEDVESEDTEHEDGPLATAHRVDNDTSRTPAPEVARTTDEERSDVNWGLLDDRAEASPGVVTRVAQREPPRLRVRSSLTIGSLRDRIFKVFELDRFDIDVVVCRKGDKNRRQLKSTVRLSKYEVQG